MEEHIAIRNGLRNVASYLEERNIDSMQNLVEDAILFIDKSFPLDALVMQNCEHIVEVRGGGWALQQKKCDRPAFYVIHYKHGGDKLACKMHAAHYKKRAEKFGWKLPEKISA